MNENFEVIELGLDRIVRTGCEVIYYENGGIKFQQPFLTEDAARYTFSQLQGFYEMTKEISKHFPK